MTDTNWTPEIISQKQGEKQGNLSRVMNLIADIEEEYDNAEKDFKTTEARLSLQFEMAGDGKMSDKKIAFRVIGNEEYQAAWANFIVAKSKLKKAKIEKEILEKELKTLESIGMNVATDLKYLNR